MIRFILNDQPVETNLPAGTVLLDFIRYFQHLTGTKIGCREGDCGACTVLVGTLNKKDNTGFLDYKAMTCCLMPLANANAKHIVTIEGLNFPGILNPIQQAMAEEGATQCGFCTPGFVVSLAGYCLQHGSHSDPIAAIDGNICRCTGYKSIERAARKVESLMKDKKEQDPARFVSQNKILPEYFSGIKEKLETFLSGEDKQSILLEPNRNGHAIIGGGTDLYVQKPEELAESPALFLFDSPGFNEIIKEGDTCIIGPSATVTDLQNSRVMRETFPGLARIVKLISSTAIRNMATIAGNFINASPIGDMTIFFLALDANIGLGNTDEIEIKRTVPLRKLYKGYKKLDMQPGEIIRQISFKLPAKNARFNFEKVSKRTHLDIASVNSAILLQFDGNIIHDASLSAGGVSPVPLFLERTSAFLSGKTISNSLVDEAIDIMKKEISPISDTRGSKEYKTLLLGQLIKAHLLAIQDDKH